MRFGSRPFFGILNVLPLLPKTRFAAAAKLAAATAALPPLHCRYLHRRHCHAVAAATPPPPPLLALPWFPLSSLLLFSSPFPLLLPSLIFVDC